MYCYISICLVCVVGGDRLKESIYTDFDQFQACFKRLNATMVSSSIIFIFHTVGLIKLWKIRKYDFNNIDRFINQVVLPTYWKSSELVFLLRKCTNAVFYDFLTKNHNFSLNAVFLYKVLWVPSSIFDAN